MTKDVREDNNQRLGISDRTAKAIICVSAIGLRPNGGEEPRVVQQHIQQPLDLYTPMLMTSEIHWS
jgi:hypothetical protein